MLEDSSGGAATGSTPRPEGELGVRHAGKTGEVSRKPLAKRREPPTSSRSSSTPAAPPLESSEQEAEIDDSLTIVRASGKILLDLRDLAEDPDAHRTAKCGGYEKCTACATTLLLRQARARVALAANAAVHLMWKEETAQLIRVAKELGRLPQKSKELPRPKFYTYPEVRKVVPELHSNLVASLTRNVERKWNKERWDVLVRQNRSPAHYKATGAIPVPVSGVRLEPVLSAEGEATGQYKLSFSLEAGRRRGLGAQFQLPIRARDAYQRRLLSELLSGAVKMGELKIDEDPRRKGRWYARIAYTRKQDRLTTPIHAAVNLGIVCALAAVTADGEAWLYDGKDIVAFLKQIQRRRQAYQRDRKASNRWGHGRTRALRPIEHLQDKALRWRQTKNQTIARRFALWCQARGVSHVYFGDFTGIRDQSPDKLGKPIWERIQEWPYFDLQSRCVACLEELGITSSVDSAAGVTRTCSACGHEDVGSVRLAERKFVCTKCGHKEHLDLNAGRNQLHKGVTERAKKEAG